MSGGITFFVDRGSRGSCGSEAEKSRRAFEELAGQKARGKR
jgi:hypothetical protein